MISHLVFRLEGVLVQTLDGALLEEAGGPDAPVLDPSIRLALRDLCSDLRAGRVGWEAWCAKAVRLAGYPRDERTFSDRVLGRLCLGAGVEQFLVEAETRFTLWLFCEAPEPAIAPVLVRLGLERLLPRSRWIFSSTLWQAGSAGALIARLSGITGAAPGELLWIDDRAAVDAALLRAGLNAVAYVDPFRLRRNLVLRGLLK
jgi:hypothetical protein